MQQAIAARALRLQLDHTACRQSCQGICAADAAVFRLLQRHRYSLGKGGGERERTGSCRQGSGGLRFVLKSGAGRPALERVAFACGDRFDAHRFIGHEFQGAAGIADAAVYFHRSVHCIHGHLAGIIDDDFAILYLVVCVSDGERQFLPRISIRIGYGLVFYYFTSI